jgi:hypothetical protein
MFKVITTSDRQTIRNSLRTVLSSIMIPCPYTEPQTEGMSMISPFHFNSLPRFFAYLF